MTTASARTGRRFQTGQPSNGSAPSKPAVSVLGALVDQRQCNLAAGIEAFLGVVAIQLCAAVSIGSGVS